VLAPVRGVAGAWPDHAAAGATLEITDVRIREFAFTPADIRVTAGSTVRWLNFGSFQHTVTSSTPGGVLDSGSLDTNQSYEFQFTQPGVYPYHCDFHPSMTGTVTVLAQTFLPLAEN
jgi:plastocyanin